MNKGEKKYRRSGVSIACYVLAAAMLVYVFYQIANTVGTINEYYAQYGMTAQPMEYITYTLQSSLQPLFYTIAFFMMGYILDAVRKNNKANYLTDEEMIAAAEAKKQAREAKKLARGEAAAAKAGNPTTDEKSVEADFARSLDEELKADQKKTENRKPQNNNNRQVRNRQGGGKSGQNKSKAEGESKAGSGNKSNSGNKNYNGNRGGQRKSSKKPADKPKNGDAKEKVNEVFEAVVRETENLE